MPRRPTFAVEPVAHHADVRGGDRAPHRGDRAGGPPHRRPPPERGRARGAARHLQAHLRQALRVLELSGLVQVRRGKSGGIFVVTDLVPSVAIFTAVKLEEEAAVDVLRARRVLERAVAQEAMRVATPADLVELERTVELLERHLGERPSVMRADAMFHRALVRSCRNETIQAAMRGVGRGLAPIRDAYSGGGAARPQDARRPPPPDRRHAAPRRERARRGARRALPHARDAVREGHRPPLVDARRLLLRSARRDRRGGRADTWQPGTSSRDGVRGSASNTASLDVAEVLAVDLQRQRPIAADRRSGRRRGGRSGPRRESAPGPA